MIVIISYSPLYKQRWTTPENKIKKQQTKPKIHQLEQQYINDNHNILLAIQVWWHNPYESHVNEIMYVDWWHILHEGDLSNVCHHSKTLINEYQSRVLTSRLGVVVHGGGGGVAKRSWRPESKGAWPIGRVIFPFSRASVYRLIIFNVWERERERERERAVGKYYFHIPILVLVWIDWVLWRENQSNSIFKKYEICIKLHNCKNLRKVIRERIILLLKTHPVPIASCD